MTCTSHYTDFCYRAFVVSEEPGSLKCNTEKDRVRLNYRTAGLFECDFFLMSDLPKFGGESGYMQLVPS